MPGNRNSWRAKLLLAAIAMLLALGAGEMGARLLLPRLPPPANAIWRHDDHLGYRLNPTIGSGIDEMDDRHVNASGFRDRDHAMPKPVGRWRVLGIGDSFVYGRVAVNDNFLRVAERDLHDATQVVQPEVLLMGCPGYSPENELAVLEYAGLELDPDLVVINFFVGNDISGIPVRGRVIAGNMYYPASPIPWLNLARKSQLFQILEGVFYRTWKQRIRGTTSPDTIPAMQEFSRYAFDPVYRTILRNNSSVYLRAPEPTIEKSWSAAFRCLERIDELCRAAGVRWILVLIPTEEQVDPKLRELMLEVLDLDPAAYDFDGPQERILSWAQRRNVELIDLLPTLRAAHLGGDPLYVPADTHWNVRGNRIAGEAIARWIARQPDLLPH